MEIIDNITKPNFVYFHKKMHVLFFKLQNFEVSADKAECIKVKSSNRCLDLRHYKIYGSAAPAS